ncbi:unnamed protein product [Pelagomonas calceolata]|uniref:Uncharacterized protein n=2 Tax=Pelagomonas calceolata TaxID=35677 RepID=A0A8J2SIP4_9STRA|nr:unnamed protein product [Pelagomonas calceolata]
MYVGPWQEYRALARARHAEALYATRGPETQVADELERLRRALELVSGELPADKAAKVREALAPVAEPGPPPLPGLSWNPRAAPRRPAPVVRPVKPPPHVLTSLRLDDVRGGAATFLLGTRAPSTDASTAGKNASAHSAQALGLADFKNAFSTPLSSRGGPAARPLSARSARSQAWSEHRTSRSDSGATPRRTSLASKVAGARRRKQFARERRRPPAPRPTPEARSAYDRGKTAQFRRAERLGRRIHLASRTWCEAPSGSGRELAPRATAAARPPRPTATPVERARGRVGSMRRAYLEGARRGDDGPRRPSVPLPTVAAPAESAPAPGGAIAKFDLTAAQMGAVAKYFGDESTPPPPVATVAPDTPAETVDDLLNWAEGLEARERAMSPPPRLSPRRRRGDEWL